MGVVRYPRDRAVVGTGIVRIKLRLADMDGDREKHCFFPGDLQFLL